MPSRDLVTTLLDILGRLLVATGATGGTWRLIGTAAFGVGGVVVLAGSWWFAKPPKQKGEAA